MKPPRSKASPARGRSTKPAIKKRGQETPDSGRAALGKDSEGSVDLLRSLHGALLRHEPRQPKQKPERLVKSMLARYRPDERVIATAKRLAVVPELVSLQKKLDYWEGTLNQLAEIPREYELYAKYIRTYKAETQKNVTRQCRELANLIKSSNVELLWPQTLLKGRGVDMAMTLYKALADSNLTGILLDYRERIDRPSGLLDDVVRRLALVQNPFVYMPELLNEFAALLEANKLDEGEWHGHKATSRKSTSEVEFVKRRVFEVLVQELREAQDEPGRKVSSGRFRNPNKETAAAVNVLLRLRGRKCVTANDISQMNKANRRRYHAE